MNKDRMQTVLPKKQMAIAFQTNNITTLEIKK